MDREGPAAASSEPFDIDALLAGRPEAARAAARAEAASRAGGLVRRARARAGLTQSQLAERVGSTQAHVSELERGLGSNGPTVATLGRIVAELGDRLVLATESGMAERDRARAAEAEDWLGELSERIGRSVARGELMSAVTAYAAHRDATEDPGRAMLLDGFLAGFYFACGAVPGQTAEMLAAIRAAIPGMLAPPAAEHGEARAAAAVPVRTSAARPVATAVEAAGAGTAARPATPQTAVPHPFGGEA